MVVNKVLKFNTLMIMRVLKKVIDRSGIVSQNKKSARNCRHEDVKPQLRKRVRNDNRCVPKGKYDGAELVIDTNPRLMKT